MDALSETQQTDGGRRRRFHSLRALQAFEAAARLGSFRGAAEELNVTHSAISHQVKALEEDLLRKLFIKILYHMILNSHGSDKGCI